MKCLERLNVFVLGDRQHRQRLVERQAEARLTEKDMILKTHDYKTDVKHKIRNIRKSVEAGPNAPLLKRIIRNPRGMEPGYFEKSDFQRPRLQSRPKFKPNREVSKVLRTDKKIRKIRPMSLHIKPKRDERLTVSHWLQQEKK